MSRCDASEQRKGEHRGQTWCDVVWRVPVSDLCVLADHMGSGDTGGHGGRNTACAEKSTMQAFTERERTAVTPFKASECGAWSAALLGLLG